MTRSLLVLFLLLPLAVTAADVVESKEALADEVLILAEDVGRWLAANATEVESGMAWPDDVLSPESVSYDLAAGVAGKVLYFTALYRATGKPEYLDNATGGADYLVATLQDPAAFDENPRRASLYTGIAGIGVALMHVQQDADRERYARAIENVVALLEGWSVSDPKGLHWSDEFNDLLYGDAGTTLFLSWYGNKTGDQRALDMAHRGARFLLSQGDTSGDGMFWYFRRSKLFNLPNFSHGTAGVIYVLATVAAQTNDVALRAGAQAGFDYLKSIAEVDEGLLRIPYGWGNEAWRGLYEFGWAHGLAGSTATFIRLQQTGIDAESAAEYERLARHTLRHINLPGTPAVPFAEPSTPLDQRFGRAGVLSITAGWDGGSSDFTAGLHTHIENAAIRADSGAHWEVEAPAFMGGGRAAYTGILHGAAGIGLAILHLHAEMNDRPPYIDLPDHPDK